MDTDFEIEAAVERMRARTDLLKTQLQAWAKLFPASKPCEKHETINFIDWDRSAWETHKRNLNTIIYSTCPECEKDAAIARAKANAPVKKKRRRRRKKIF